MQQARSGLLGPAITGANEALAQTYSELATTNRLLKQTQVELGLQTIPTAKASGRGSVLRVSGEHPDPVVARDIASKLSELLIRDIQTSQLLEIARLESLAASQGITVDREVLQAQMITIDSLRVIESAEIPLAPFAPSPAKNTVLGVAAGLMLAVMAAFLFEYFSRKIRSAEQIVKIFDSGGGNSRILGTIFRWKSKDVKEGGLVTRDQPYGIHSEMFRQLRSGFHFARTAQNSGDWKVFVVTSATPSDGKSTITANLAVSIAHAGGRVIVVDGDLHAPTLHSMFNLPEIEQSGPPTGLGGLLMGTDRSPTNELTEVGIPGLKVLIGGTIATNPADLLSSPGTKAIFDELREQCDVLLIDSPPVLAAVDSMILADYADGVIVTVNMADSRLDVLQEAYRLVHRSSTPILGYVLNKVTTRASRYDRYYRQYGYGQMRSKEDGRGHEIKDSPSQKAVLPIVRAAMS